MKLLISLLFFLIIATVFSQNGNDSIPVENQYIRKPASVCDSMPRHEKITSGLSYPSSIPDSNSLSLPDTSLLKQKAAPITEGFGSAKDSLKAMKHNIKDAKDSARSTLEKQLKAFEFHGNISAGYEYGVLPFVINGKIPSGGYKTEGRISFSAFRIPLELTFYYTDIKNVVGLNNYFRISYDADRYKEKLSQNLSVKDKVSKEQVSNLQLQQQQTMQKIEYLKFLEQSPMYQPLVKKDPSLQSVFPVDSSFSFPKDSLNMSADTSQMSTYRNKDQMSYDTSGYASEYIHKKDSVSQELIKYRTQYDSINNEISMLQKQRDQIDNLKNNPGLKNPYLSKVQNFLSSVKKFDIGLCTPSYSTFLVNNIPLQGINIEFEKNNNFLAFTYGTTINNLLYNTNTLQGTIQSGRNLYNYFDFGNLEAGRKIICLKGGTGAKEETHLYAGILLAKGKTDYLSLSPYDPMHSGPNKESNVVLELDGRYKFSEQLSVDVVLGKSSVKEEDLSMEQVKKSVNEIFSNYRSYAVLTRANTSLKWTKTKLTFTVRWIDPYFKSFGLGFLRSDNLRYEAKAEQPITKRIKYTIAYRREEDNLLKLHDYKNLLQSINNTVNFKLNRRLNLRLIYAPLFRELKTSTYVIKDRNYISTAIISYTPKAKKVNAQFNALYSKYLIGGDSVNINFENVTYTHQFLFRSGFKTDLNVSWFKNNLHDTIGNDTYFAVLDIGYSTKNNSSFVIGGKMAYKKNMEPQYGYRAKVTVRIYKGLLWDAEIEKIIIGDYYNSYMVESIRKFPVYCNTRLILNF